MFKQFFSRTYRNKVLYKLSMDTLASYVKSFSDNQSIDEFYYDDIRNEGFIKGKKYYLTFELHQVQDGVLLETTTSCKLPFFIPKTYSSGFYQFVDIKKDKSH